ncbi:MAG: YncE family protein [Pseudolabrys sp.]
MIGNKAVRGMIAVDKIGTKILFLHPRTHLIETVLDGFQKTVHELLVIPETGRAYVPIFGDGIHGRNPNPGHVLLVIDCLARKHIATIDLSPLSAPHTLRLCADGLIYITCENSAKVAAIDPKTNTVVGTIDSGSTNGHRLAIPDDGKRLYTDNEEDATVSVIDVPNRKLLGKIATPEKLAGIAVSADGTTVIAVSDDSPVVFVIDTAAGKVVRTVPLEGVEKAAQIARFSPDGALLVVSSLNSNKISIIDAATFGHQSAIGVGSQPMDFAFRGEELLVGCQGDGTVHMIDVPRRRNSGHFKAGSGCESIGFF